MNKQEFEELFPVGCVVSQDIKEKIGFGKWEGVWQYEFSNEIKFPKNGNNMSPTHTLDINRLPSHSFGAFAPMKPAIVRNYSYKRIG